MRQRSLPPTTAVARRTPQGPRQLPLALGVLALLLAVAALAGCGEETSGGSTWALTCSNDAQCFSRQTCQFELCVDGARDQELQLSFYFQPPGTRTDLTDNWVRDVPWTTGRTARTWQLDPPVSVQGTVRRGEGLTAPGERSTVFFAARNGIPGRRFRQSAQTDDEGNFTANLPGKVYDITITPQRDDVPETTLLFDELRNDTPLRINLPGTDHYTRWQGRVVQLNLDGETIPVTRASIIATSVDGSTTSTRSDTDAEGRFAVYVDPDTGPYRFQVRPGLTATSGSVVGSVPSVTFIAAWPEPLVSDSPAVAEVPGGGDLVIGQWPQPRFHVGSAVDTLGNPVPGARVLISARIPEALTPEIGIPVERAIIEQRAIAGRDGRFVATLVPGVDYRITAIEVGDQLRLSEPLFVTTDDLRDGLVVTLEDIGVAGVRPLTLRTGEVVPGLTVAIQPETFRDHPIGWYDIPTSLLRYVSATGPDGVARLPAFEGSWTVRVDSGPFTSLAPTTRTLRLAPDETVDLQLDPATVIAGRVADANGNSVAGVAVEIYAEFDDTSRLLGTGTTDANGQYRVVIPVSEQASAR